MLELKIGLLVRPTLFCFCYICIVELQYLLSSTPQANFLGKAVEYIRVLKNREARLARELAGLKTLLGGLVGGRELLHEWERLNSWTICFGGPETDELSDNHVAPKEDGDDAVDESEDDGAGRERNKPKMECKLNPERKASAPAAEEEKTAARLKAISSSNETMYPEVSFAQKLGRSLTDSAESDFYSVAQLTPPSYIPRVVFCAPLAFSALHYILFNSIRGLLADKPQGSRYKYQLGKLSHLLATYFLLTKSPPLQRVPEPFDLPISGS
ncbi:hypothetical protein B0H11DRAFT_2428900 [Mycena galericulata]|nr:hypothetical protein B0H11DRAFT_2428900 [Mycena galericulata]